MWCKDEKLVKKKNQSKVALSSIGKYIFVALVCQELTWLFKPILHFKKN